ncbi:sugar nucleotide-binding protein [Thermoflavimicrobium dichotomicum]|uniref:dTDP-4-dehydrorhamnose reductase n=1 Tax=Thermoflavimicrobium dichotomicum TaxID=46223 RepID=A0A1I3RWQ0_9BACL|nr:sugar nucleotide-binding protein [Thermoflavimicrobium dichotomicum]SFJ51013.1 dTDP-4-dehydrorhamnose reductase [Thermoflavimicrobium dichotomicum]
MKKILILGISGTVGKKMAEICSDDGRFEVYGTYQSHGCDLPVTHCFEWNVGEMERLGAILQQVEPDIVFSALRGDFGQQMNAHQRLARYVKEKGRKLIFCSTGNVFDDDFSQPHAESDPVKAQSEYGRFKADCERELSQLLDRQLVILRLPFVMTPDPEKMMRICLQNCEDGKFLGFHNLYVNMITDETIAKFVVQMLMKPDEDFYGVYHVATTDWISHSKLIEQILQIYSPENSKLCTVPFPESKNKTAYFALLPKRINWEMTCLDVFQYIAGSQK